MISKHLWHIKDKWKRHKGIAGNPKVSKHIPPTRMLNSRSLPLYLNRYKVVYIKPVYGSFGNNILKVTQGKMIGNKKSFILQREKRIQRLTNEELRKIVHAKTKGKKYLVQKGIPLVKLKMRSMDFRTLLVRPKDHWIMMGTMGKLAERNRAVTNFNHGGEAIQFRKALRQLGWSEARISRTHRRMVEVAMEAAKTFSRRYKHCRRLGIDYGLDQSGRIWIIEINTNPRYELYHKHQDPKRYATIDRFMKQVRKHQKG